MTDQAAVKTPAKPKPEANAQRSVYILELWSFIPYYIASLSRHLATELWNVTVGSVRYHLDREYFSSKRVRVDPLLLDFGGSLKSTVLRRLVKTFEYVANLCFLALRLTWRKPDILHIQYLPFLERGIAIELIFLRWVRFLSVPIVYTVHNLTRQDAPNEHEDLFERAYRGANALICHSKDTRVQLESRFAVPSERIWLIPHGPLFDEPPQLSTGEARRVLGLPQNETVVLCLGVISPYKGIPFLLDAWKQVIEGETKAHLVIAGAGEASLLEKITHKVSDYALFDWVDLRLQYVPADQMAALHQAADILVYPYQAGTTSGALLAGRNYGKPIVATKLPFFLENLENGKTGFLIDYGDVPQLASALSWLIEHPQDRVRMGNVVQQSAVEGVKWPEIAQETIKCYESVLSRFSAKR